MAPVLFTALLLLFGLSTAQLYSIDYLDVTLSSPNAPNCGQGTTGEGNAVTFSVTAPPSIYTCFNVNETFSNPNVTYSTRGYSCLNGASCGVNYTITGAENFNSFANYSQIWYRQNSNTVQSDDNDSNKDDRKGRLRFQTYNGLDCLQVSGDGGELEAWYAWNCIEPDGACGVIPYDVRSFAILPLDEDEQGDKGCVVSSEYANAGTRPHIDGIVVALVFALLFTAFLSH